VVPFRRFLEECNGVPHYTREGAPGLAAPLTPTLPPSKPALLQDVSLTGESVPRRQWGQQMTLLISRRMNGLEH
jgi:hypothetical protein